VPEGISENSRFYRAAPNFKTAIVSQREKKRRNTEERLLYLVRRKEKGEWKNGRTSILLGKEE